jgi:hypothetical protein
VKRVIVVAMILAALFGCAEKRAIVSTNPDLTRVGEEPAGYPRTFVERVGGACIEVTESWREDHDIGDNVWVKDAARENVPCPEVLPGG